VVDTPLATHVSLDGVAYVLPKPRGLLVDDVLAGNAAAGEPYAGASAGERRVEAPLTGTVAKVSVSPGDRVAPGQTVLILEAMKMEIAVSAPRAGVVSRIACAAGDLVQAGALLAEIGDNPAATASPAEGASGERELAAGAAAVVVRDSGPEGERRP
jgi:biotin carboxyl carrier protein